MTYQTLTTELHRECFVFIAQFNTTHPKVFSHITRPTIFYLVRMRIDGVISRVELSNLDFGFGSNLFFASIARALLRRKFAHPTLISGYHFHAGDSASAEATNTGDAASLPTNLIGCVSTHSREPQVRDDGHFEPALLATMDHRESASRRLLSSTIDQSTAPQPRFRFRRHACAILSYSLSVPQPLTRVPKWSNPSRLRLGMTVFVRSPAAPTPS